MLIFPYFQVNPPVYSLMAYQLSALAGGKVLAVLEGGYHLAALADSAAAVVETFVKNRPSKQLNFGKLYVLPKLYNFSYISFIVEFI